MSALITDSQRYSEESPRISFPDAIIVSGDLVRGVSLGSPNYPAEMQRQYNEALELLTRLADFFVDSNHARVILIPGNHDVDWNAARLSMATVTMDSKDIRSLLQERGSRYRWDWKNRQLFEVTDDAAYRRRFDYFVNLYRQFYSTAPLAFPLEPTRDWNLFSLDGGNIVVAAFNSCVANDCFNFHGEIPSTAISDSHLALLNSHAAPKLRIAVWHHDIQGHPLRSDYMDQHSVKLMIDRGYRLGLHGHQHKSEASPSFLYTAEAQQMSVVSAGSLCAAPAEIPAGFQRQYNLIEISDYAHARVHVRESQFPSIFTQGTLPGLGNPSYVDVSWTPPPSGAFVNVGRGGGATVATLESIERLVSLGRYPEAVLLIDEDTGTLGNAGRLLKTEALYRAGDWQRLKVHLTIPVNEDELTRVVTALINSKEFDQADKSLADAGARGLSSALIYELRKTVRAERTIAS